MGQKVQSPYSERSSPQVCLSLRIRFESYVDGGCISWASPEKQNQ